MNSTMPRPPPLIAMPIIQPPDDEDEDDDIMTKEEEEAAAHKFLLSADNAGDGASERRLSSLDVYLLTHSDKDAGGEPMLLNRKTSLRKEEDEISHFDWEQEERRRREEREEQSEHRRREIQEERRRKTIIKEELAKSRNAFEKQIQHSYELRERKKKGLGGLSRDKRRRLKEMILNKAHEEMQTERRCLAEKRKVYLDEKVGPLDLDSCQDDQELIAQVQKLHMRMVRLEQEKYDLEEKVHRQELEMHDLTQKVSELKGKYNVPVLRKVCKRMTKLEKLKRLRESSSCEPTTMREKLRLASNNLQKTTMDDSGMNYNRKLSSSATSGLLAP